jgi:hypothetical protein
MLGRSIVSQHFMEPERSIPNSQQLSTCSYPYPDQSSPHPIFCSLGRLSNDSVQVRGLRKLFVTSFVYGEFSNPTPNPQAAGPPLFICPLLLIKYIRS